jgi:hypothetical protein
MLNTFGQEAFRRASDNAYIETLMSNEAGAASWRRVMVVIRDLLAQYQSCDGSRQPSGKAA